MKYLESANDEVAIFIAVETYEAVRNIEDLISVEGIDGIFIGPSDLSSSMGYLCKPDTFEVQQAIRQVEKAVIPSNIALSTISGSFAEAKDKYEKGYDMITLMSDTSSLSKLACTLIEQFETNFS